MVRLRRRLLGIVGNISCSICGGTMTWNGSQYRCNNCGHTR